MKHAIATPNERNRTFTVRIYNETGELILKKRTYPMNKSDFEEEKRNTSKDWLNYLTNDNSYTV